MAGTRQCGIELAAFHIVRYWRDSPLQRPLAFKLLQHPVRIPQLCISNRIATVSSHRLQCYVRLTFEHTISIFICITLVIASVFICLQKEGVWIS